MAQDTTSFLRLLAQAEDATDQERWPDAAHYWCQVVEINPVDGRFWLNLADARIHDGDIRGAIEPLEQVLALRQEFPPETMVRLAGCHAHLGDESAALDWLERAIAGGHRDLAGLERNDDFAALRPVPRFQDLVGLIDDSRDMSRDDAWRFDLRFAAREIKRRAYAPFGEVPEPEFDAVVARIDHAIPGLTDHQVIIELMKLVRRLNDGHARVRPPEDREDMQRAVPLQFFLFEEGLFVTAAAPEHEALLGAEILAIGGHDLDTVIAAFEPVIARDNENRQWFRAGLPPFLREPSVLHALGLIPEPDRIPYTVRTMSGEIETITIEADASWPAWKIRDAFPYPEGWRFLPETLPGEAPHYLRNADLPFWFQALSETRTLYFQFNQVRDAASETLAGVGERILAAIEAGHAEKLVIDMRWNGGGNTFKEMPLLRQIIASRRVNRRGALFVIIGRNTFSAAQNGVNFLSHHSRAIFVGEPTGSSPIFIGETNHFELPHSKTVMNISDLRWVGTWPDDYRIWLPPTLYAPPTFALYRQNRDPAMEAIQGYGEHLPGQ
ncbi:MAG: tetratricopeptide repeat protein [Chloroflexota bacterium]|nr:tetratricopeptide repeat protein [Chloroflexota bacterium]